MKQIHDDILQKQYIDKYHIRDMFLHCPTFEMYQFDKGEIWNSQMNPNEYMIFLVRGKIHFHNIRFDGSLYEIHNVRALTILGDMEFSQTRHKQLTIISDTSCVILAVSLHKYRPQLEKDYIFLKHLLKSVTDKFDETSQVYIENETLEKRLLYYMKQHHNQLEHIEKSAHQLCCSRRQLQRLLKKLCDENVIVKMKKGKYLIIQNNDELGE